MKSICRHFFALVGLIPWAVAQTNIARGKPMVASSQWSGSCGPARAANGDISGNTCWHCASAVVVNSWWQVELASSSDACSINQIVVHGRASNDWSRLADVVIELWDGDPRAPGTSSVIASSDALTGVDRVQAIDFAATGVRFVRFFKPAAEHATLAEMEVFGACGPPVSVGAGGDPHIKLFSGASFDFHGHCDLLLLDSPAAANGAGVSIQVRSSPYKETFSYTSAAAIQIGDHVLTIGSNGQHAIDGVPQVVGKTGALVVDKLHQHPVHSSASKKGRHVYKIHLKNGPDHGREEIDVREYKNWITIAIIHPTLANWEKSVGLLGRFPDGALLGRDGKTIHASYVDFGQDWQVAPGDSLLGPGPFLDHSCAPLEAQVKLRRIGRRLEESSITRAQAAKACEHWGNQIEDCVNDVQISEDLEMANTMPI